MRLGVDALNRMYSVPAIALPGIGLDPKAASPSLLSQHQGNMRHAMGLGPPGMNIPGGGLVSPSLGVAHLLAHGAGGLQSALPLHGTSAQYMQAVRRPGMDPFVWARSNTAGGPSTPSDDSLLNARALASPAAGASPSSVLSASLLSGGLSKAVAGSGTSNGASNGNGSTANGARGPMSPDPGFVSNALNREFSVLNDMMAAHAEGGVRLGRGTGCGGRPPGWGAGGKERKRRV